MDTYYCIQPKLKNKHFSRTQIENIIIEVVSFEAAHKGKKRNTGKTQFLKDLAVRHGCSLSSIYRILKISEVITMNTYMQLVNGRSAQVVENKRKRGKKNPDNLRLGKAAPFVEAVVHELKKNKLASIDEQIHRLSQSGIYGSNTICTKTFYNYVHRRLVDIKPIDLPRMTRRKRRKTYKTYIGKRQKGVSIDYRDPSILTREEFGHWEGDLVTGPKDGKNGAYLTLIERKTRFYLMLPIKNKSSKQVYMQINKLEKIFGDRFKDIFKTITFDNGSEFARWKDIEQRPGSKEKRTEVFFAHPYRSCERGSNENCNGLIRRFLPKGTNIGAISPEKTFEINQAINQKPRKINDYITAEELFLEELANLKIEKEDLPTSYMTRSIFPYLQNLLA
jgi:IS30 family transposase